MIVDSYNYKVYLLDCIERRVISLYLRTFYRYGEIVNINLVRDKATGRSRGFSFICYEDQRSTILAVDNLNGIKVSLCILLFHNLNT